MTSKLSFKVKILSTLILVLIATVTTSYISINYYVSIYIFDSDENSISAQINLVKEKLEDDIASKIFLAENIKIGLTGLDDVKQRTDFYSITKVLSDLVVNHQGRIEDETLANKYIDQVEQSDGVTLSDVFYQDDIPLVSITIPRGNGSGDIFYIDLRNVQSLLSQSTVRGSYIELRDPKHNLVFSNKVKGDLIALESPLSIGNKQWQLTGYIDKGFISERTNSLNTRITLALLMVSLITIPGSIFILNKILSNLSSLRNIIVALSRGDADLTRRLDVSSQDDLGNIAQGINDFIANLQRMMLDVFQSSRKIRDEIGELTDKTDSNKALLAAHAEETEKVVAAINEMSATAESVAQSGARAAEFTQSTNDEAEKSKSVVKEASDSVLHLSREVDAMALSIGTMSKDFEKIDAVLRVIGEIAEQTNLLALNAAIEAARAGEQGRGFAVVADEVRALAARTQQSTFEVDQMLANLRSATSVVVNSMDTTKKSCSHTVDNTSRVMGSLEKMTASIIRINDLNTQIALSAKEQSVVTEDVNKNMIAIHEMIAQLSSNASDTVNSTERLIHANAQLNDVVSGFKLGNHV